MEVLAEYHLALGELVFAYEGTLEHFAGDGLLVFFNDPVPCPDAPDRAVRMAVDMRARVAELAQGWRRKGHDLGFGVGIAQGYATLGRVGFPGRYDYAAIGTVTNLAARLCAMAGPTRSSSPSGCRHGIVGPVDCREVGPLELKGFSRPVEAYEVIALAAGRGVVMSDPGRERTDARRARRGRPQRGLRPAPGADAGGVDRDAARRRARVGGRRAVDDPRPGRGERRRDEPGPGGALPVPPAAAAPAPAADGLRHLAADQPADRRLLPLAAPGRHPRPRAVAAVPRLGRRLRPRAARREDPGPPPADRPDPRPRAGRARCRTWSRTTPRPSSATSPCCSASRCTAPTPGSSRSARRPDAGGSSRAPGSGSRRASRTCTRATTSSRRLLDLRAQRPGIRAAMVKLNEGVAGAGNAVLAPRGPPGAGQPGRAGRGGLAGRRPGARGHPDRRRRLPREAARSAAASSRSGSSATSCAAPACRCGSPRWARSRCSRPTTRCSAARAGSPTSAAGSPPTPGTRA